MSITDSNPIGVDFGTSNSSVAMMATASKGVMVPRVLLFEDRYESIPTAVYFTPEGRKIIGNDAITLGAKAPDRLYIEFKRNLDPHYSFLKALSGGTTVSANDLAAIVLESLLKNAEKHGGDSQKAVICHPVGNTWQKLIENIAKSIGRQVYTLSEPEAVLYYAHYVEKIFDEKVDKVLLIDFGGGTCDFLLMEVKANLWKNVIRPVPHIVDEDRLDFGGKDIDQIVVNYFLQLWKEKYPSKHNLIDHFDKPSLTWKLTKNAKEAKEILSRYYAEGISDSHSVELSDLPGNTKIQTSLTPSDLLNLTEKEIYNRFFWLLLDEKPDDHHRPLLGRKNIKPDDLTMIILAGGSSQLPWIREKILPTLFPALAKKKQIYLLKHPQLAVAYGAALFAYDLYSNDKPKLPKFLLEDLRIELGDGNTHVLAKIGTQLPVRKEDPRNFHVFIFPRTGKSLTLQLRAGNDNRAAHCRPLAYEPKTIEFVESIQIGTKMQMKVQIDTKGEVHVYISKVIPPWAKTQTIEVFFQPLEISSIPSPKNLEEGK